MIANITTGNKAASMILYNENKVKAGKATKLDASSPIMLIPSAAIDVFDTHSQKTKTENSNVQISLSLALGENVSDETFINIAQDYLKQIGFNNTPYVIYRHKDTKHQHIHICTSIITHDDQKVDMYYNYIKSMKATRDLEQKYNLKLVSSINKKDENQAIKGLKDYYECVNEIDTYTASKSQIRKIVAKGTSVILQQYKPTDYPSLKKMYAALGIDLKEVLDENNEHKGYVFRLLDRPETPVINASSLYMAFTKSSLEKTFAKNSKKLEKYKPERIKTAINQLMKQYDKMNIADFERLLSDRNIKPMFDRYANGKIYGLSFLDQKSGYVIKASQLGKEYSYNKLKQFTDDNFETKATLNKLLEDIFYKLYNEARSNGSSCSALEFAKHNNTLTDLKISLFEANLAKDQIESISINYLENKVLKLQSYEQFKDEKLKATAALNDYYKTSVKEYLVNYSGTDISNYLDKQIDGEKHDYVDYISQNVTFKSLDKDDLYKLFNQFAERKKEEYYLLPLRNYLREEINLLLDNSIKNKSNYEKLEILAEDPARFKEAYFSDFDNGQTILNKYDQARVEKEFDKILEECRNLKINKVRAGIIEAVGAKLTGSTIDEKIAKYNYFLLDKSNFENAILANLPPEERKLFTDQQLFYSLKQYVEKVESFTIPFLNLTKKISETFEERKGELAYMIATDHALPNVDPYYFNFKINEYNKFLPLFNNDKSKLETFVRQKIQIQTLKLKADELVNNIISQNKIAFTNDLKNHLTGNVNYDFYSYILKNKDLLKASITNAFLLDVPDHLHQKANEILQAENNPISRYLAKIENINLPMIVSSTIINNEISDLLKSWKIQSKREMAERLLSKTVETTIKANVIRQLETHPIANKVINNPKLLELVNKRIIEALDQKQRYYSEQVNSEILDTAQSAIYSVGNMVQNKTGRDGLNTAKNDKKGKRSPD